MATDDKERRRRLLEELRQAVNSRYYEPIGWDFSWKAPKWANPPWSGKESTRPSSRRGPVFDAMEEHLRTRSGVTLRGARAVHLLRYVFDTHEAVRAFFAEADRNVQQRREEAATEARQRREGAERERAREAVPGDDREAFAWERAQAKLAAVTGQNWLQPCGYVETPAWDKAAEKLEALRSASMGETFVMGFDPGDGRGEHAAYVLGRYAGGRFYVDHVGIAEDDL